MASRENQALHIAIILLVMFTALLFALSFWFYSKWNEASKEAERAQTQKSQAEAERDQRGYKNQALTYMIGKGGKTWKQIADDLANIPEVGNDEELDRMLKKFHENMLLFGPEEQAYDPARNYEALPTFLLSRIRDLNQQLVTLRRNEATLTAAKTQLEQAAAQRTKKFEDAAKKAGDDLLTEREKFNTERARINKEKDQLAGVITTKDNKIVELQTKVAETEKQLTKRVNELAGVVDAQKIQLKNLRTESFETADATITSTNQKAGIVYIGVGSADNLHRQQTFSVYDKGTSGLIEAKPKGRLEVTQILGDHVAACRVLEDDLSNIILPGDLVFTPAWSPGQTIHFAIAGFIDITGNSRSDRELLASLIHINGGVIDDQVTPATRYLIIGERRGASPGGEMTAAEKSELNQKIVAAQEIGVDQVSVDKLLTLMGWRADVKAVTLGRGSRGDFQEGDSAKEKKPAESTPFRPRTPPRGKAGAF